MSLFFFFLPPSRWKSPSHHIHLKGFHWDLHYLNLWAPYQLLTAPGHLPIPLKPSYPTTRTLLLNPPTVSASVVSSARRLIPPASRSSPDPGKVRKNALVKDSSLTSCQRKFVLQTNHGVSQEHNNWAAASGHNSHLVKKKKWGLVPSSYLQV